MSFLEFSQVFMSFSSLLSFWKFSWAFEIFHELFRFLMSFLAVSRVFISNVWKHQIVEWIQIEKVPPILSIFPWIFRNKNLDIKKFDSHMEKSWMFSRFQIKISEQFKNFCCVSQNNLTRKFSKRIKSCFVFWQKSRLEAYLKAGRKRGKINKAGKMFSGDFSSLGSNLTEHN